MWLKILLLVKITSLLFCLHIRILHRYWNTFVPSEHPTGSDLKQDMVRDILFPDTIFTSEFCIISNPAVKNWFMTFWSRGLVVLWSCGLVVMWSGGLVVFPLHKCGFTSIFSLPSVRDCWFVTLLHLSFIWTLFTNPFSFPVPQLRIFPPTPGVCSRFIG